MHGFEPCLHACARARDRPASKSRTFARTLARQIRQTCAGQHPRVRTLVLALCAWAAYALLTHCQLGARANSRVRARTTNERRRPQKLRAHKCEKMQTRTRTQAHKTHERALAHARIPASTHAN
eukprot:5038624-Pleurochrysis_carterae.AAC.1